MPEELKIEYLPIKKLKPFENNPRIISDDALVKLTKSIKEFGYTNPVLAWRNNGDLEIVAGYQRIKASKEAGLEKVPVIILPFKDQETALTYNIADNRLAELTDWDTPKLKDLLQEVDTGALDVGLTGFDNEEIEDLMAQTYQDVTEDGFQPEEVLAQATKAPNSKPGEIYELGPHKLMCGDATNQDQMELLMDGNQADMVFMDPPYNVDYKGTKSEGIMNDNMSEEQFVDFTLKFMAQMTDALKTGGVYYVCSGYSSYAIFLYAIKAHKLTFSCPIIWVKNNTALGWNDYRHKYEQVLKGKKERKRAQPILYGWNGGSHYWKDTRFEADVWEIKRVAGQSMAHPTQKPLALVERAIMNSSQRKELVLDMFGGSGATLIAAEQTGRICNTMELDPVYCDVIRARYDKYMKDK